MHLNRVDRRRKRGSREETKGPKGKSRSLKAKANVQKFKLDKGHGTLSDIATRRPACQGIAEDSVGQGLKDVSGKGIRRAGGQPFGREDGETLWSE